MLTAGPGLRAADFEIGPQGSGYEEPAPAPKPVRDGRDESYEPFLGDVPLPVEAGDVPTAHSLRKYELRTDLKFHSGGGILGKSYLGLFSRFFLGGAVSLRNFIGSGDLRLTRDDAQLLARLQLLDDGMVLPSLAVGWDGPAYDRGEAKGLYVAVSKTLPGNLNFAQLHGGVNTANVETFVGARDLRANAALTASYRNLGLFSEVDEVLHPAGPRWNAGFSFTFEPITLGLEFRDLASPRPNTPVTRLLRVGWTGRF